MNFYKLTIGARWRGPVIWGGTRLAHSKIR